MKRYLLITPWCPYPPHKNGGVHTIYNMIKNIPKDIEMDLLYYYEKDDIAEKVVSQYINSIAYINLRKAKNLFGRINTFLEQVPDYFSEFNFKNNIDCIEYVKYDVIILDQIISLPFLDSIPVKSKVIVMMHDNNVLLYQRKAARDRNLKRYYDKKQCDFFFKVEARYFKRVKKVIYVSELDAQLCAEMHKEFTGEIDSITLGVDIPLETQISREKCAHSIVFSGVMDYEPNEDAALFFANEIFPQIKQEYSDAKFIIAGKNPTDAIKQMNSEDILVTGFVSDMIKTITKYQIYVSPLRYGSGTKNKVLEAMAAGMPVFASEVSREGISGLKDKENCFFINEKNMADVIIDTLNNDEKLKLVALQGKKYVEEYHSWKNVFDKFTLR